MKAFISYSHKDIDQVEPFVNYIENFINKKDIFFDKWSVNPGDSIIGFMNKALESLYSK